MLHFCNAERLLVLSSQRHFWLKNEDAFVKEDIPQHLDLEKCMMDQLL